MKLVPFPNKTFGNGWSKIWVMSICQKTLLPLVILYQKLVTSFPYWEVLSVTSKNLLKEGETKIVIKSTIKKGIKIMKKFLLFFKYVNKKTSQQSTRTPTYVLEAPNKIQNEERNIGNRYLNLLYNTNWKNESENANIAIGDKRKVVPTIDTKQNVSPSYLYDELKIIDAIIIKDHNIKTQSSIVFLWE